MNSVLMHSICHNQNSLRIYIANTSVLELRSLRPTLLARIELNLRLTTWEIGYARSIFVQFAWRVRHGKSPGSRSLWLVRLGRPDALCKVHMSAVEFGGERISRNKTRLLRKARRFS